MATKMMSLKRWKYHAKFKRAGLRRYSARIRKYYLAKMWKMWDFMLYARSRWRP